MSHDFETPAPTHASEEELIMAYYDEAPSRTLEHLAHCAPCREEMDGLRRLLDRARQVDEPELDAAYGQRVWAAIEGTLEPHGNAWVQTAGKKPTPLRRGGWLAIPSVGRLGWLAATLLLVAGAYVVGRSEDPLSTTAVEEPVIVASGGAQAVLEVALVAHFESSGLLLKELSHVRVVDESSQLAARAERLLAHNRLFRASVTTLENPAVGRTLDEIERWLLDLAHLQPASASLEAVQVRSRQNGLRLRLEMLIQQLRREDVQRPLPELDSGDNHVQSV